MQRNFHTINHHAMNTLTSPRVREALVFAGLLGLVVLASTLLTVDPALAGSLIDSSDAPSAISGATGGEGDFKTLANRIINFFLGFLGFISILMVIYAGILYVTSAGNDESVGKAKKILLYAVIGIIVIFLSFALVNTILGAASGGSTVTS